MNALAARRVVQKYISSVEKFATRMPVRARYAAGAAIGLVLLALWYYTGGESGSTANQHSVAAPVRVATVVRRDMPVVAQALGTVVANTLVQVTARVQGTLDAANFKEGQVVKKGDLILQIDPRAFEVVLDQARAVLLRDEALLRNAVLDKQRYENLYKQKAISDQLRDTSATNADVLSATVAVDSAAVKAALLNLGYTRILSPSMERQDHCSFNLAIWWPRTERRHW